MAPKWFDLNKEATDECMTGYVELVPESGSIINLIDVFYEVSAASSSHPPATEQAAIFSQASSFPLDNMMENSVGSSSTLPDRNSSAGAAAATRPVFVGPDLTQLSAVLKNDVAPNPNSPLEPPVPEGYILLDVPAGRKGSNQRLGVNPEGGVMKPEGQRPYKYHDPHRRCSNFNCQTIDTPMWRKGPMGAMTLCNACGIKYRKKEAEKKKQRGSDGSN